MSQYEEERIICAQIKEKARKIHNARPEPDSGALSTLWQEAQSSHWVHRSLKGKLAYNTLH